MAGEDSRSSCRGAITTNTGTSTSWPRTPRRAWSDFTGHLAGPAGAMVVDRRDNMFDARKGWLFSTSAEWGWQGLGSDFDYLRTLVRGSFYQPLGPLTLASNARWGNLQPFGGQPPVTVLDIFYNAGGTQTVRGYKEDRCRPTPCWTHRSAAPSCSSSTRRSGSRCSGC